MSKFNAIMMGASCCMVAAFPCAALLALVWQFPVPFSGFEHGSAAVPHAMYAVFFYGIMGGFPLLGVLGGIGGAMAHSLR